MSAAIESVEQFRARYKQARERLMNVPAKRDVLNIASQGFAQPSQPYQKPFDEMMDHERCKYLAADVARRTGVSVNDIKSARRDLPVVRARHELMWLLKENTKLSLAHIGRHLGRDHTSVISGIRKHIQRMGEAK